MEIIPGKHGISAYAIKKYIDDTEISEATQITSAGRLKVNHIFSMAFSYLGHLCFGLCSTSVKT